MFCKLDQIRDNAFGVRTTVDIIAQENQTIAVDAFSREVDAALGPNAGAIRSAILTELDV
jgi:hypothetical protein